MSSHNSNDTKLLWCLNKGKCKKRDLMKNCDVPTDEEKGTLLKKHRAEKARRGRPGSLTTEDCTSDSNGISLPADRFKAKLADTVDVIVNGDYGADHSAFSSEHLC